MEIAERIRRIVAAHPLEVETSSGPAHTTISMGVACYPRDGLESSALVHQADLAVYRAKLQGRNRVLEAGTEPLVETVNSGSVVIPLPPAAPVAMSVPAGPASSVEAPGTTASTKPSSAADRAPIGNSAVARAPRTDARSARPHEAPKPRLLALSLCLGLFVLPVTLVGVAAGSAGLAFGATRDFVGLVAVVALVGIGQSLALEVAEGSISVSAVGALAVAALFGFRAALALAVASAIVDWSARRSPSTRSCSTSARSRSPRLPPPACSWPFTTSGPTRSSRRAPASSEEPCTSPSTPGCWPRLSRSKAASAPGAPDARASRGCCRTTSCTGSSAV